MNLFIDTNVLLDFYHLSGPDITELNKLVNLLDQKTVVLYLPANLAEEFERNRGNKIADAIEMFKKASFKVSFPAFCKLYPQYEELQALTKKVDERFSSLYKAAMDDAKASKLKADEIVAALFKRAHRIEISEGIFTAAMKRLRFGNPPGKKKVTIGDELSWEALLSSATPKEDLHLVSHDSDYVSPLDHDSIHPFLLREWRDRKNSTVTLYRSLPAFFKVNIPRIVLASDVKRSALIEQLANSKNFASTHVAIAALSALEGFSPAQVEELIQIAESNNQVGWIMTDDDVNAFYRKLEADYGKSISPDALQRLKALLPEKKSGDADDPWEV